MEVRLSLSRPPPLSLSLSTSTSPSPSTSLDLCLIHTGIVGVFSVWPQPVYGYPSGSFSGTMEQLFKRTSSKDVFYIPDTVQRVSEFLQQPLPSVRRCTCSPSRWREGMAEYAFVFFLLLLFFLTAFWYSLLKCTACSVQLALAIAFHIFVFSSHPTQLSQATGSPSTAFSLPCRRTRQVRLCLRFNKCCSAQLLPSVSEQPHSLWLDFCFDCGSCLIPPPPPPPPPPLSLSLSLSLVCSAVHSTSAATDGVRHVMLLAFRALRACAFALICLPRAPALTLFIGSCFHLHACLACLR